MGFSSWKCPECGYGIICPYDIPKGREQYNKVALVTPINTYVGEYDGYGRIHCDDGMEMAFHEFYSEPKLYHKMCWLKLKDKDFKALKYSEDSHDQGYFYEDKDYPPLKQNENGEYVPWAIDSENGSKPQEKGRASAVSNSALLRESPQVPLAKLKQGE